MNESPAPSSISARTINAATGIQVEVANLVGKTNPQVQAVAEKVFCDNRANCNKPAGQICAKCRRVFYCAKECQTVAWKEYHKRVCVPAEKPEEYSKRDEWGLTPLHHSVLCQRETTLAAAQKKQLSVVSDSFNGTPAHLKELLDPPTNGVIALHMLDSAGKEVELTQQEFVQRTGVKYKDGFFATSEALLNFHRQPQNAPPKCISPSNVQVARFQSSPPKIFLAEEPGMGLGLKAGQNIARGEIVCCTGGEWSLTMRNTYRSVMYQTAFGAAQDTVSGAGIFINDGPPSCIFSWIRNYKGLPFYPVVLAIRDIQAGEFLHLFYGPDHGLRGGKYAIGAESYQEVVRFCKEGSFYNVSEITADNLSTYQNQLFLYIFGVSSLFIALHLRGVLDVSKTKELMQKASVRPILESAPPSFYKGYPEVLDLIAKLIKIGETDTAIVAAVDQLSLGISEAAYVQVLLLMNKDAALTSKSMPAYLALGELYDHLYLVVHGTLCGSYLEKEEGPNQEKMPVIPLDFLFIFARYASMPIAMKSAFFEQLLSYISFLSTYRLAEKKQKFEELAARLQAVH